MYYFICTENKNTEGVETILKQYFPNGFNIFAPGKGVWKGVSEASLTIGVLTSDPELIQYAALDIKELNQQESVLVLSFPVEAKFL